MFHRKGVLKVRAREFLDEVARPNVTDLAADFGNIRKALNAIHAVDALAVYIYNDAGRKSGTGAIDDSKFRGKLSRQNPDFRLLWDLAKAAKHVVLERGAPIVSTAEQVKAASLGFDVGHWDELRWDGPPQAVVITDAGDHRSIEAVVSKALDFLEGEMARQDL
jgi:hypothetical protein